MKLVKYFVCYSELSNAYFTIVQTTSDLWGVICIISAYLQNMYDSL